MFKRTFIAIGLCLILLGGISAEAKVVTFKTDDGVQIVADYYPAESKADGKAPVAILIHMFPADRRSWRLLAPELGEAGFAVLAYDIRGNGDSNKPESLGLAERYAGRDPEFFADAWKDVAAAKKWLATQKDCDTSRIALIGASIGCSISLQYGSMDRQVKSIACLSPGTDYFGVDSKKHIASCRGKRILLLAPAEEYGAVEELIAAAKIDVEGKKYAGTRAQHGTGMLEARYGNEVKTQIIKFVSRHTIGLSTADATKAQQARKALTPKSPLSKAIAVFRLHTGEYPQRLQDLVALPKNSPLAGKWKGPYVKKAELLNDPWGHPYGYRAYGVELQNKTGFDLWSMGPDGVSGTDDDIKNWR